MNCSRRLLLSVTLLVLALLLAACRSLPLNGPLPENLTAVKITSVDAGTPFAVTPEGNVVALVKGECKLYHIPSGEQVLLSPKRPHRLVWSPFGLSLAALFHENGTSRIITYDQIGTAVAETVIDAPLTDIGWLSENELALGGAVIKEYRFGSNYRTMLYRWKPGRDVPVASELRDTTLQPATMRTWQTLLKRGPLMDFSSQTPLISYLHPVDPPLFTPYYKLVVRDLASGKEVEAAAVSLNADGGRLSGDGEKILFGDGKGATLLRNPWSDTVLFSVAAFGAGPVLSADADSWFADGALFRGGRLVTPLAAGAVAQFSTDGSHLFLRAGDELFRISGLKPAAGSLFVPALTEKLQKLRSLRAEGLISPQEYQDALERITRP